ncbi:hypothetical protein JWV37_03555 [Sulfurospirillum sp. T05]|uniref:Uncharacterized protein n=1 Tax=Sulfurospirillum tamanense TaxID=2813362 RepID=A0ABS2WR35_9BACT|nr:hypothetical protein [Sulfurospirillum tamanensis]MBN2963848.1 hypothetical protein [Sulfurospirillum tamanensis]
MNESPLALRLRAQSFPADSALCSTERAGKTAKNSIMCPKVFIFLLWAFWALLSTSTHAFTMPTQTVVTKQAQPIQEQTQSTQIEKDEEEEGVLKFLRSAPDPQKLPLSFDTKDGYVAKVAKMDYSSGEIALNFYIRDTMEQVGEYKYIHHAVKAQTTPTAEEIQTALASLPTQKDRASEYRKIYRTDRDVDFAQFLVAVLTFDDEVVDFSRSILENRVRLKGAYTPAFSVETFDDKILLFYISMFANVDEKLNEINSWVLFLVLPFAVFFMLNRKITTTISGKHDPADYWGKGVYSMAIIYSFYVISGTISVGEAQISRTNFQALYGAAIRKSVEFATAITEAFGQTYVNVQRKNSGMLSKEEVEKIAIEQLATEKKIKAYGSLLATCEKAVGDIFFREEGGKYRVQQGMSTISPLRPEYRRALLSLELCDFSETTSKTLTAQKEENDRILGNYGEAANDRRVQTQLSSLADSQIRNIESFGFFSLPLIAAGNMFSENIGLYDRNVKSQSQIEKTREEIRKNEGMEKGVVADSVIAGVIETLPYLMLPAAGTVSSTISATVGSATSTLEKIPFFGNLVAGAKQAVAHGVTIFLYSYLVKYLPLITLVVATFLVLTYWLLSMVVYLFISPYMVVWMLSNSEEDAIRKFLVKGLVIWSRPLTLAISVVLCVVFLDLFGAITDLLVDEQFANFFNITMSQGVASATYNFADFGLFFVKGFFSVAIAIIGVVLSFYITFNGAEILLKMLGVGEESGGDAQGIIGREIDNRGGQYSRPMSN